METSKDFNMNTKKRFKEICEIEPLICAMYLEAKAYQKTAEENFCANNIWYGKMKMRFVELVGWSARRKELRNCIDYDVAYDTIYEALPDCKHPGWC